MTATESFRICAPPSVCSIAARLEQAGYQAWAVGGAVRNAALGIPAGDWDLATSARPPQVQRLFRRTVPLGLEHGTVGVLDHHGTLYEVTTFRRDVETFGRHAVVEYADTVDEDLARRDFTLNAMAWRPATGELRDPFGGLADLRARRLATVGVPEDRFAEDYLRVLRALRFSGHFQLSIEPATWRALTGAVAYLDRLSAERVREELWKIFKQTCRASAALSLFGASGAVAALFPELERTIGIFRERCRHDAWSTSLLAVDAISRQRPLLRMAALLHAVDLAGDPASDPETLPERVRPDHTGAGRIMRRLRASNAETEWIARLVTARNRWPQVQFSSAACIRQWLHGVGSDLVPDLFRLHFALLRAGASPCPPDALADSARQVRQVLRQRPPLRLADLAIGGNELGQLGLQPGPGYGQILQYLLSRVIHDPTLNSRDRLLEIVREELL